MDQVNERFTHHFISQNQILREQRDKALNESERAYKELELLKNINGDSLSPDQEQLFTSIVKQKLSRSKTGSIQAHNVRGRPTNLVQVRSVEIGSAEASSSTIRQRSKFYERLETICCARKDSAEPKQDVVQQRSSLIKRNKEGYFEAAKIAGLAIFNKFKLDPETALSLKKEMPLNLWKTVKRTLNDSFGVDLMGTERQLREGLRKHGEFEYEVGEFINSSGETVTFLRVTDFETLYKTSVEEMKNSGLLSKDTSNTSLLVCGDKGGSSTKIVCQFTSSEKSQSVRTAKLLGIYQGSKESRENVVCIWSHI